MNTRKLSLLPLNAVLFPEMMLPLHIFEDRYKKMIQACLDGDLTFGVALIKSGQEVGGPAEPYAVGTTARIEEWVQLEKGDFNLIALGGQRFRILAILTREPFLQVWVEFLKDAPSDPEALRPLIVEVSEQTRQYLGMLLQSEERLPRLNLPKEPERLSYTVASALRIPALERQELLELMDTRERLERLQAVLEREIKTLRERNAEQAEIERIRGGNGRLRTEWLRRSRERQGGSS